ncbi:hypothetical protein ACFX2I_014867 [Malus domestica]
MTRLKKLAIAHQLAKLRVDVIEVEFPASSKHDLETMKLIAKEESVKDATRLLTSEIHMKYKLNKTADQVLELTKESVRYARSLGAQDITFRSVTKKRCRFICSLSLRGSNEKVFSVGLSSSSSSTSLTNFQIAYSTSSLRPYSDTMNSICENMTFSAVRCSIFSTPLSSSRTPRPWPTSTTPSPLDPSDNNNNDIYSEGNGAENSSGGGMSGGKKVGIPSGVIVGVGLVGLGGFVYKKRQDNIRGSQYSDVARRDFL